MAAFYNTDLDDDKVPDGQLTFEGGMFSNALPRRIKPEQCSLLVNSTIEVTGEWSSRRGTAYLGGEVGTTAASIRGLGYYRALAVSSDFEIAAADTHLYYRNGGNWTQLGAQTFSGSSPIEIVQGGQGGGLATVQDDKLYVAAGGDLYRWNGTAWTDLSTPETANSPPRAISILTWHTGRLVAAGATIKTRNADVVVPDAVYFSNELDGSQWGVSTYDTQIRVGGGDGADITALVSWKDFNLAVFKRHSVWVVNADPSQAVADFPIQKVSDTVGCIARNSAVQVGNDVIFLSDDGVRTLSATIGSDQQHELGLPLSFPIQNYVNRINWAFAGNSCAVFWKNLYILAAPLDSATTNNFLFVFNTLTGVWAGVWTNLPIARFAISKSAVPRLVMGLTNERRVVEYLDYINEANATDATYTDYDGNLVLPAMITREFAFTDEKAYKKGAEYEVEWHDSKGGATIVPILDGKTMTPDLMNMSTGGFPIPFNIPFDILAVGAQTKQFDLMRHPSFRGMQIAVITSGPGRKEMRQIVAKAFLESDGPLLGEQPGQPHLEEGDATMPQLSL